MSRRRRHAVARGIDGWREAVIEVVARILNDPGAPSKFCHEGACRAGLRSEFCLTGKSWSTSDAEAAHIVRSALACIGATARPSWIQGQPEYCQDGFTPVDYTTCIECGRPLPDDWGDRYPPRKFCSQLCGDRFRKRRDHGVRDRMDRAERLAMLAARRTDRSELERECEGCGKGFIPLYGRGTNRKYCSSTCAAEHRRKELPVFICLHCKMPFSPSRSNLKPKYCSQKCSADAQRGPMMERPEKQCEVCLSIFRLRHRGDRKRFCSNRCGALARRRGASQAQATGM